MSKWEQAKAAAQKILGPDAKIPDKPAAIDKADESWDKAAQTFKSSHDDLEDKLLAMQNANSALINGIKQFGASIEKNDFDLDAKADAKKLVQGRKILTDAIKDSLKTLTENDKTLDELDKHLVQMGKYKSPPSVM